MKVLHIFDDYGEPGRVALLGNGSVSEVVYYLARCTAAKGHEVTVLERDHGTLPEEELIDIEQFAKTKLVVGKVIECTPAPDADKLLLLKVDLGTETRQLVAGIASWYSPEELIGKNLVIVANLKPAKIRGYESRGMLLAAESEGKVRILTVDGKLPPGAKVK